MSACLCGNKDLEDPTDSPRAKIPLTVVRIESGSRQAWGMIDEAKKSFSGSSPIIITDNDDLKKLKQFCGGRVAVFVHPSLYRALKLTFPWDIGGVSQDGIIKFGMGCGSMA